MLGSDIGTGGWPRFGERDILENLASEPSINRNGLHGPGYSDSHNLTGFDTCADACRHPRRRRLAYSHPFFFILNFTNGGWPDAATSFPQTMRVNKHPRVDPARGPQDINL